MARQQAKRIREAPASQAPCLRRGRTVDHSRYVAPRIERTRRRNRVTPFAVALDRVLAGLEKERVQAADEKIELRKAPRRTRSYLPKAGKKDRDDDEE